MVGSYSRDTAACALEKSCFLVGSRYMTSVGSLIFLMSHHKICTVHSQHWSWWGTQTSTKCDRTSALCVRKRLPVCSSVMHQTLLVRFVDDWLWICCTTSCGLVVGLSKRCGFVVQLLYNKSTTNRTSGVWVNGLNWCLLEQANQLTLMESTRRCLHARSTITLYTELNAECRQSSSAVCHTCHARSASPLLLFMSHLPLVVIHKTGSAWHMSMPPEED